MRRLAFTLIPLVIGGAAACTESPRVERHDGYGGIAPVTTIRKRDQSLNAPSAYAGDSQPGLGTTEPTR
jgi:hypothetical protein